MSERFGILNNAGTYLEVSTEQFAPYRSAGYRRLKLGEEIPLQAFEQAVRPTRIVTPPVAPDAAMLKRARKASPQPPAQPTPVESDETLG